MTIYKIEAGYDGSGPYITFLRQNKRGLQQALDLLEAYPHPFHWINTTQTHVDDKEFK